MDNPELGRKVLDYVTSHPGEFDMTVWGGFTPCGTVACLAGHTMLLAGYQLARLNSFHRPDGTKVRRKSAEAAKLLGLVPDEQFSQDSFSLFGVQQNEDAIKWFRRLVEKSEAVQREQAAVRAGDIGRTVRRRELEPLTAPAEQP